MLNKQNLHTHTTYVDGKDTPEEIILAAIEKGFSSIGFSEHSLVKYTLSPNRLDSTATERYKAEIRRLKDKYRGILDIFCGLEYDFYSEISTVGLDYLIGSVHYLDCGGEFYSFDRTLRDCKDYIRNYFGGDSLRFAKKYYETLARLTEIKPFDIIGHFDLITKCNELERFIDTDSKTYLDAGFEAIHTLKGRIPFFEVNTGAIARGYRTTPYPQLVFLREFANCGFGAVISSDCHDRTMLDYAFEEVRELMAFAGFRTRWILTDNGFEEVTL